MIYEGNNILLHENLQISIDIQRYNGNSAHKEKLERKVERERERERKRYTKKGKNYGKEDNMKNG